MPPKLNKVISPSVYSILAIKNFILFLSFFNTFKLEINLEMSVSV